MQVPVKTHKQRDPYARLLDRLTLALDEADNLAHLTSEPPPDMEVRGLSPDELALITAYLVNDRAWLNGWHATAARYYQAAVQPPPFERQPALPVAGGAARLWASATSAEQSARRLGGGGYL